MTKFSYQLIISVGLIVLFAIKFLPEKYRVDKLDSFIEGIVCGAILVSAVSIIFIEFFK